MRRFGSWNVLGAVVPERKRVDVREEVFAGAKQNRADSDVHHSRRGRW